MYGLSIQSKFRIIDSKGKESTINFNHPVNSDIGVLKNALRSTAALIDALIRGQVIGCTIELVVNLGGALDIKASAILGSDVEEGVRFAFETTVGGQTVFRIPTVDETWLNSAGILQVTSGSAVDDFIQRILAGQTVVLTNVHPSDAYGDDVDTFIGGYESFVGSAA